MLECRLILIVGSGRSGSTILQRLLAEFADVDTVGEAIRVADCAFIGGELCGCGERLVQCPTWAAVLGRIGVSSRDDAIRMIASRRRALRPWEILRAIARVPSPAMSSYLTMVAGVLATFAELAGVAYVVDSSKHPLYTSALAAGLRGQVRVVHLTRDPRAVAYSLSRRVARPDVVDRVEFMPQYSASRSALAWVKRNFLAELTMRLSPMRVTLRYEDLMANPEGTLEKLRRDLGMPVAGTHFLNSGSARLAPHHSVAGNPSRMRNGNILLSLDEEWRSRLDPRAARLVVLMAWPLMRRYGYHGNGSETKGSRV